MYDFAIIGGGAAGLFASISAPKEMKKIVLEKTKSMGTKVLLSGGERANLTNIDIEATRDYFGQNRKAMISILKRFSQYDTISLFEEAGIRTHEEDRGRIILESGNSKELLDILMKKSKANNTELKTNFEVKSLKKIDDYFEIVRLSGEKIKAKKVLVRAGGKSFSQVGTTGDGYNIAQSFGLKLAHPYRSLSAFATKKDLSSISGVSTNLSMTLFDKTTSKEIYSEFGPILFTHFGLSGPIIFNASTVLGEYLNKTFQDRESLKDEDFEKYIIESIAVKLNFDLENTPKRRLQFFELNPDNLEISLDLQNWRSWKEAKATGGGILLNELDNNLQAKNVEGLYFAGEVLDLTGKTGGFNLQLAWSTGYIVGTNV
ncbi:MAG: aminoacetone oxidase family FAD-binding enzyme [Candidatus Gracilibacteria bacterium]|nr:aminoacetone oxidase family FAD-binding enzyme [Candidatus Gracilibacteria bacterium]